MKISNNKLLEMFFEPVDVPKEDFDDPDEYELCNLCSTAFPYNRNKLVEHLWTEHKQKIIELKK